MPAKLLHAIAVLRGNPVNSELRAELDRSAFRPFRGNYRQYGQHRLPLLPRGGLVAVSRTSASVEPPRWFAMEIRSSTVCLCDVSHPHSSPVKFRRFDLHGYRRINNACSPITSLRIHSAASPCLRNRNRKPQLRILL